MFGKGLLAVAKCLSEFQVDTERAVGLLKMESASDVKMGSLQAHASRSLEANCLRAWQVLVAGFLQKTVNSLIIHDAYKLAKSDVLVKFLASGSLSGSLGFSFDVWDL